MTSLPLNSVVASVTPMQLPCSPLLSLHVKGYALPGAPNCGKVSAVEVSIDDGATWTPAAITYQEGPWSWTLWEAIVDGVAGSGTVYCRAKDEVGGVQSRQGNPWTLRGVGYCGWSSGKW
jgi:sulfite oxidase